MTAERWMKIHANGQEVFNGTADLFPPGNGQEFEINSSFPEVSTLTINISHGQNSAFGNYFVMKFDSLELVHVS
jgi:hypothetical protein